MNYSVSSLKTLLIVDSHLLEVQSLNNILEKSHYKVLATSDAATSWRTIQKDSPDICLIVISSLESLNLILNIRRHYTPEQLPIIVIGNKNEEESLIETLDHGANDYIVKPYNKKSVLKKIYNLICIKELTAQHIQLKNRLENILENSPS
ncbi:response regulator [bacterium]|nr:response regulator [bacterium]